MHLVLFFVQLMIPKSLAADDVLGKVFAKDSDLKNQVYTFKREDVVVPSQESRAVSTFYEKDVPIFIETAVVAKGKIKFVDVEQKQTNQKGHVEVKDGKIEFTVETDGVKKTSTEKLREPFVMSSNLQNFVRDNWAELSKGQAIDFRFGVWDRRETVGFQLKSAGKERYHGKDVVRLEMKPSNYFISKLVDPLEFYFVPDGTRLQYLTGRIPPKEKIQGKWKDQDAEIEYTYK